MHHCPFERLQVRRNFQGVSCVVETAQALLYPQDHPNTILVDRSPNSGGLDGEWIWVTKLSDLFGAHLDGIWEALSYPLWLKSPSRTIPWFVPSFAKTGPADVSVFGGRMRLLRVHHRHSHASVFFLREKSKIRNPKLNTFTSQEFGI